MSNVYSDIENIQIYSRFEINEIQVYSRFSFDGIKVYSRFNFDGIIDIALKIQSFI
jgi:hypothetical protein